MRLILILLLISFNSYALKHETGVGAGIGLIYFNSHNDPAGFDKDPSAAITAGIREMFPLSEKLKLRTGIFLDERSAGYTYDIGVLQGTVSTHIIYFSIPLNLQYQVSEKASLFSGYFPHFRNKDYCNEDGDMKNICQDAAANSIVHYGNAGLSYALSENVDVDFSYQHAMSENYQHTKIHVFLAQFFRKY